MSAMNAKYRQLKSTAARLRAEADAAGGVFEDYCRRRRERRLPRGYLLALEHLIATHGSLPNAGYKRVLRACGGDEFWAEQTIQMASFSRPVDSFPALWGYHYADRSRGVGRVRCPECDWAVEDRWSCAVLVHVLTTHRRPTKAMRALLVQLAAGGTDQ